MSEFVKHPSFDRVKWVVGTIDSHGAVDARVILYGHSDDHECHEGTSYKRWRWCRGEGLMMLVDAPMYRLSDEETDAVLRWLYKRGLLNAWEIDHAKD